MAKKRRKSTPAFKAKVALAAIRGERTLADSSRVLVNSNSKTRPVQIPPVKMQFAERSHKSFYWRPRSQKERGQHHALPLGWRGLPASY